MNSLNHFHNTVMRYFFFEGIRSSIVALASDHLITALHLPVHSTQKHSSRSDTILWQSFEYFLLASHICWKKGGKLIMIQLLTMTSDSIWTLLDQYPECCCNEWIQPCQSDYCWLYEWNFYSKTVRRIWQKTDKLMEDLIGNSVGKKMQFVIRELQNP